MKELTHICDGVFWNDENEVGPHTLIHKNTELYRFMDKFYIRSTPDKLTPIEVSELCRQRSIYPHLIGITNQIVRDIFKKFVMLLSPQSFLEIGAGSNPILSASDLAKGKIACTTSDADPRNDTTTFSGIDTRLAYADGTLEMAAALFVLHFHFYDAQISELHRSLADRGVFLANIYGRTQISRDSLRKSFNKYGLYVHILKDPNRLCKNHEYWFTGKDKEHIISTAKRFESEILKVRSRPVHEDSSD